MAASLSQIIHVFNLILLLALLTLRRSFKINNKTSLWTITHPSGVYDEDLPYNEVLEAITEASRRRQTLNNSVSHDKKGADTNMQTSG